MLEPLLKVEQAKSLTGRVSHRVADSCDKQESAKEW